MLHEISLNKLDRINKTFPYIKYADLFPSGESPLDEVFVSTEVLETYDNFAISVHDHWLNEKEIGSLINYPSFFNSKKLHIQEEWNLYQQYESRFVNLYKKIYEYEVFMYYMDSYFVELKNKKVFTDFIRQDIREMRFHRYAVPELGILITGNFDLTHIVHASKQYYKKEEFEKIVKDSGLYILR